nr:metal-independent phosphoserine phosphatase [Ipomoea batatas]
MEGSNCFLRNRYWVLRHGKSIPNELGLIVSSMVSERVEQARLAGDSFRKELIDNKFQPENVRICYSPFSRTRHTAKVVASQLDIPFEGAQCMVWYGMIWDLDEKDPFKQPEEGGESVADVVSRLTNALTSIEKEFQGCAVLIVSHGDPLQILQTILSAAGSCKNESFASKVKEITVPSILSHHRKFALLTGELRAVP